MIQPAHLGSKGGGAGPAVIEGDRNCEGCGYNLRGLALRGRCPECGRAIRRRARRDAPLAEMPVRLVRRLQLACWLVTLAVLASYLTSAAPLFGAGGARIEALMGLGAIALWLGGAWLLTGAIDGEAAEIYGFGAGARLRPTARWLQVGWLLVAVRHVVVVVLGGAVIGTPLGDTVEVGQALGSLVGLGGVATLIVLVLRLAAWARDDHAERVLNFALWGIPGGVLLSVALSSIPLVGIIIAGLLIAAVGALPYGLIQLSRSLDWSIVHTREHDERERRRLERKLRDDEERARRSTGEPARRG